MTAWACGPEPQVWPIFTLYFTSSSEDIGGSHLLLITIKEFAFIQTSFRAKIIWKANKNNFFTLLSHFVWSLVPCWVPNATSASSIEHWGAHSTWRRAATQTGFPVLEFGLYQIALCKRQRGGDCLCQRAVEQLRSGLGGWHNWWRGEEDGNGGERWRRPLKNCDRFITEICTKVCIRSIGHQNICTNIFLREK